MVCVTINIYREGRNGGYEWCENAVYTMSGRTKEHILEQMRDKEFLWQAIEMDNLDNAKLLVELEFEENGEYLDRDEYTVTTNISRTSEPSDYILWGNRNPSIFKINRKRSSINVEF